MNDERRPAANAPVNATHALTGRSFTHPLISATLYACSHYFTAPTSTVITVSTVISTVSSSTHPFTARTPQPGGPRRTRVYPWIFEMSYAYACGV